MAKLRKNATQTNAVVYGGASNVQNDPVESFEAPDDNPDGSL